ncbi:MAG: endonuclease/exonuclease/phosphatase family protein [Bacteroidota bacterium]
MRIATFNIENLDDAPVPEDRKDKDPSFEQRLSILRPQLQRLKADILCLQEVHGQDMDDGPRELRALKKLLEGTMYEGYQIQTTHLKGKADVEKFRNLVTLIHPEYAFEREVREIRNDYVEKPAYKYATGTDKGNIKDIGWNRPILYSTVRLPNGTRLHIINAHFKSKNPTRVAGEGPEDFKWKTVAGWTEGFFLSSMKRVGQALETRIFIDTLFHADSKANIVICGDINAETEEVPMQALRGEVEDTGNPALNDRIMYPLEHTVPEPSRFTLYHHGRKNLLDHLLVSQNLLGAYRGSEIHNEIVRDESRAFAYDIKFPSSDHAPIIAEFDDGLIS